MDTDEDELELQFSGYLSGNDSYGKDEHIYSKNSLIHQKM
jgi:hypothetical protein